MVSVADRTRGDQTAHVTTEELTRDRGRRRLVVATAGVSLVAVGGASAVGATRPTPVHLRAKHNAPSTVPTGQISPPAAASPDGQPPSGLSAGQDQGGQVAAPAPGSGPVNATSSGS